MDTTSTFVGYGNFAQLGCLSSFSRFEPRLILRNKKSLITFLRAQVIYWQLFASLIYSSQAVIFFYFFHDSFRVDPLFLLVLFLLVVSLQQLILVFSSSLQNQLNFKRLAAVKIIFSLVFFGLSIFGLTVNPSAISLFSAWSLALLIHFYYYLHLPLLFRWVNISINRIKLLIADGFIVFQGGL